MKTLDKITYKLLGVLLLTSIFSFSNTIDGGKTKKSKTIRKEFNVTADNTVAIDNKYGDLTITSWSENRVSIVVTVTVKSKSEDRVEEKLNDISISFNKTDTHVYATTNIKSRKNWSFFAFGSKENVDFRIDYEIKIPITNNLDLENDYGNIYIDKLTGSCTLNCDYGGIHLGELHNKTNTINMDYGQSSDIDFINSGKINSDYSRLSIEKANRIDLKADYSHFEIGTIKKIKYRNDYGSLKIDKVQELEGNGDYLSLKVRELGKSFNVDCDYGSIRIYGLQSGFEQLIIAASYTGIRLGVASDCSFDFDTTTSYADISFGNLDVDFTFKEDKMFTKHYKGNINRGSTNSILKINSSYGGIKLSRIEE